MSRSVETIFSLLLIFPPINRRQDLAPVPQLIGAVAKVSSGLIPTPFFMRQQNQKTKKPFFNLKGFV